MYSTMSSLIKDLKNCKNKSVYAVNLANSDKDSFSLCLPNEKNDVTNSIIRDILCGLEDYQDDDISKKNAVKIESNKKIEKICKIIKTTKNFKNCKSDLLKTNYIICKLTNNDKKYLLIKKIAKTKMLKHKYAFMQIEDKVTIKQIDNIYLFDTEIDLIFDFNEQYAYSLSGVKGLKTINYSEQQKELVMQKFNMVEKWSFLANPKFIDEEKRSYKYVYEKLYVALSNDVYLTQISNANPETVKSNIQNNYPKLKDEKNYDNNSKIKLSDEN